MLFFFFQAEDGIRDWSVTGVQTCALPISRVPARGAAGTKGRADRSDPQESLGGVSERPGVAQHLDGWEIGRASCRERVEIGVGGRRGEKKEKDSQVLSWSNVLRKEVDERR